MRQDRGDSLGEQCPELRAQFSSLAANLSASGRSEEEEEEDCCASLGPPFSLGLSVPVCATV